MIYIIEALNRFFEIDFIWIFLSMITGVTTFKSIRARKTVRIEHSIFAGILAAYCTLVLSYTIFSREATGIAQYIMNPIWAYKLMPFDKRYSMEVVLNYILFIPVGFLTPRLIKSRKKYFLTIINGFFFSAAIEITQLVSTTGLFELEDILGNTIGTIIGAALYYIYRHVLHHRKKSYVRQHRTHMAHTIHPSHNVSKIAPEVSATAIRSPQMAPHRSLQSSSQKSPQRSSPRLSQTPIRSKHNSTKMERYDAYIRAIDQQSRAEGKHHAHNYSLRHSNIDRHHRRSHHHRSHIRVSHYRR